MFLLILGVLVNNNDSENQNFSLSNNFKSADKDYTSEKFNNLLNNSNDGMTDEVSKVNFHNSKSEFYYADTDFEGDSCDE